MAPLSAKESIAMTMYDLANGYEYQYGKDKFFLNMINTGLTYFPKCLPLLQCKANYFYAEIKKEKKKTKPDTALIAANIKVHKATVKKINALGYKDMAPELYAEWGQSVEKEKKKRPSLPRN